MARTHIDIQVRPYGTMNVVPGSATLIMTPGDPVNGNQCTTGGRELVIAHNTDSVARWIKLTAAEDAFGRTGDTGQYPIPAGKIAVFSLAPANVWRHQGNLAHIDVENEAVMLAVVQYQ